MEDHTVPIKYKLIGFKNYKGLKLWDVRIETEIAYIEFKNTRVSNRITGMILFSRPFIGFKKYKSLKNTRRDESWNATFIGFKNIRVGRTSVYDIEGTVSPKISIDGTILNVGLLSRKELCTLSCSRPLSSKYRKYKKYCSRDTKIWILRKCSF